MVQTWLSDVKMAKDAVIDGFALNLGAGGNSWQRSRVGDAFTAAETMGGFGMNFSFDMT
jgi:glucan endo-1,3-alpha-glucosidase